MLFLKMVFITLFYYRNASVTEKTNHLNCIFTKEVFAAPDIITNSAFLTNFNVFNIMFQLSVLILHDALHAHLIHNYEQNSTDKRPTI